MTCLIHSPAFNCVQMAWVAGVGRTATDEWTASSRERHPSSKRARMHASPPADLLREQLRVPAPAPASAAAKPKRSELHHATVPRKGRLANLCY